jgi:uncharacterized protein
MGARFPDPFRPNVIAIVPHGGAMLFLVIGLAAGVLAGLFGIGGGIIIVPALILLGHMKPQMATGTSLGALLLPVGLLGAWQYWERGEIHVSAALLVALGLLVGAFFGAKLGLSLPPRVLQRAFAVFMVAVAVRMWIKG